MKCVQWGIGTWLLDGVRRQLFHMSNRMTTAFGEGGTMSDADKSDLTQQDWIDIHAKAWSDDKFRALLETDPTAAIRLWAAEQKRYVNKIVDLSKWVSIKPDDPFPAPGCC